jgi:hypothetical protein
LLGRGRRDEVPDPDELVGLARRVEELHALAPALVAAAATTSLDGQRERTRGFLREFEEVTRAVAAEYRGSLLARAVRLSIASDSADLAETLIEGCAVTVLRDRLQLLAAQAALRESRGEAEAASTYLDVAGRWDEFGEPYEEAVARLGLARCLEASRPDEAASERERAGSLLAGLAAVVVQ